MKGSSPQMKDLDAYESLPKETRKAVEAHGRSQGLEPQQVHDDYLGAQAKINPGKPLWHRNLYKRQRGPNGNER